MAAGDDTVLDAGLRRTFGPYTTTSRLGAGGMGTVYAAEAADGTKVAVKAIRSDFAGDPAYRARFSREVEAARRVRSDHVAHIIDADLDAAEPWFAAEFVDGPSVADLVRRTGPLTVEAVAALAVDLAQAVAAMHGVGVIHRDVKPANVVIGPTGAKLVDFGIARPAGSAELTETGMVIGSPQFMAPEQRSGGTVGPAADVYGWAATVVFAATGRVPGDTQVELGCTGALSRLVRVGLSASPELRPGAGAVVFDLLDAAPAPDDIVLVRLHDTYVDPAPTRAPQATRAAPTAPTAPPGPSAPSRRAALLVSAVVAVTALIAAVVTLGGGDEPGAEAETTSTTMEAPESTSTSASTTSTTETPVVAPELSIPGFTFDGSAPTSEPSGNNAVGGLRTGMLMSDFVAVLGPPDRTEEADGLDPERASWDLPGGAEVGVGILENGSILDVDVFAPADSPVRAALAERIVLGSSREEDLPENWQGADDLSGPHAAGAGGKIDRYYSYTYCFPGVEYSDIRDFGLDRNGVVVSFRTYSTETPALACG